VKTKKKLKIWFSTTYYIGYGAILVKEKTYLIGEKKIRNLASIVRCKLYVSLHQIFISFCILFFNNF